MRHSCTYYPSLLLCSGTSHEEERNDGWPNVQIKVFSGAANVRRDPRQLSKEFCGFVRAGLPRDVSVCGMST